MGYVVNKLDLGAESSVYISFMLSSGVYIYSVDGGGDIDPLQTETSAH